MKERLDYISNLRFPLILGVVFMHSSIYIPNSLHNSGSADVVQRFIVALAHGRIPTFFIISGFLFFRGLDVFNMSFYKKRLQSRYRSLILPYVLWTLICLIYLCTKALPSVIQTHDTASITNMLTYRIFWIYSGVHPLHVPLWYVRDLIVMSIFSPVIWLYLKHTRHLGMLLLIAFHTILRGYIAFTLPDAVLFFSMGAYFAMCDVDFRPVARQLKWWVVPILIITAVIILLGEEYSARIASTVIPITYLCLSAYITDKYKCKMPENLTNSVFFIYASHTILITSMVYSAVKLIIPDTYPAWILLARHFLAVAVITTVCVLLYHGLKRIFPKTIAILTGNRK